MYQSFFIENHSQVFSSSYNTFHLNAQTVLPSSLYSLTRTQLHLAITVHFIVQKLAFIDFIVIKLKSTFTTHLPVFKWTIIHTCLSFHFSSLLLISNKFAFVISFIFFKSSLSIHISSFKIPLIISSILPIHLSVTLLKAVNKFSLISSNLWICLFAFSIRFIIFPCTFVCHSVKLVMKLTLSWKLSFLKISFVVRAVWINVQSFAFWFSLFEITLEESSVRTY